MTEELKTAPIEWDEWDGYLTPVRTAKDLRESVGQMQILMARMAKLLQDTRERMEEMQAREKQVTATHAEVKRIQAAIRAAADDFCGRHGLTEPEDVRAVRADIKKTVLSRWQVTDLHDIPQVALGSVGKLIGTYGNIRLVLRLREKRRGNGH